MHAPFVNSYRRLQPDSWAPANLTWGFDNRTTLVRVCGSGEDRRLESGCPGPTRTRTCPSRPWSRRASKASSRGSIRRLRSSGNGYRTDAADLPRDLAEAVRRFEASELAARAFGVEVHEHILRLAAHERDVGRQMVTDVELVRGFEIA